MEDRREPLSEKTLLHPFWSMTPEETFRVLSSSPKGISEDEAKERLSLFGSNIIDAAERLNGVRIFANQFRSPLILILVVAGGMTLFLKEWVDAGVIFSAVAVNTFLGFWQEYKAESVLELLRSYIRTRVRVRRGGKEEEIDAEFLVPGDVIRISRGDRIPADARIFYASALQIDESVLTGESVPQEKTVGELPPKTPLPDRTPAVFSGTLAVEGAGEAVVTATDAHTEFGKISSLIRARDRERNKTPLQAALAHFSLWAGVLLGALIVLLFFVGLSYGYEPFEMFLISVAVAVSAVPEGLPIALTVILSVGVERLSKQNAVIRKLLAAETLGSTTLILTDKTGTLTEARMTLSEVYPWGNDGGEAKKSIIEHALLHSTAIIENPADSPALWRIVGNPLESALLRSAESYGVSTSSSDTESLVERLPFDARRKFSAVFAGAGHEKRFVLLGAPDALFAFARMSSEEEAKGNVFVGEKAISGCRVIGVASKPNSGDLTKEFERISSFSFGAAETYPKDRDYTFEGFLILKDPIRAGVKDAIHRIRAAGVKTIIVSGDHRGTAEAVARELGMVDGEGAVLTGEDLNSLKKEELMARADETAVYARVSPEQKMMLVNLYKEKGEVVAVTGDGVNDAPALEAADIGVAVGSGTDVTKSAADLVILDDNYETIVEAVSEGRRILDNIRKVIVYLLSNSLDELLIIGGAIIAGVALPLTALQILYINFFSDSFPAIALAFEEGVDDIGARPRQLHRSLFDNEMKILIFAIGVPTSLLLFFLYYFLLHWGFPADLVRTFIFTAVATYTLILSFSLRSLKKSILEYNPFSNLYLVAGVVFGIFLTFLVVYVPFFQRIFYTVSLPLPWFLSVFAVGVFNILAVELGKFLYRRREL